MGKHFQKTQEVGNGLDVVLWEPTEQTQGNRGSQHTEFFQSDSIILKLHFQGHAESVQNPGPRVWYTNQASVGRTGVQEGLPSFCNCKNPN